MITWVDIVIEAFKAIEKETKHKEINIKERNFVLQVGRIAHDARKIQQPDIDRKINLIVNKQGKENFKKISKNNYLLVDSPNIEPDLDYRLSEEMKGYEKMLEDLKRRGLSETDSFAMIKTRIGQGLFRDKLFKKWQGCSVTGYEQEEMLIASHILPWSKCSSSEERLDVENGLLLTANLDRAFDKGFITFEDDGRIRISGDLEHIETISINPDMQLRKKPSDKNKEYLKYHREHIFQVHDVDVDEENDDENDAD